MVCRTGWFPPLFLPSLPSLPGTSHPSRRAQGEKMARNLWMPRARRDHWLFLAFGKCHGAGGSPGGCQGVPHGSREGKRERWRDLYACALLPFPSIRLRLPSLLLAPFPRISFQDRAPPQGWMTRETPWPWSEPSSVFPPALSPVLPRPCLPGSVSLAHALRFRAAAAVKAGVVTLLR
jgi:hypothetical protein